MCTGFQNKIEHIDALVVRLKKNFGNMHFVQDT